MRARYELRVSSLSHIDHCSCECAIKRAHQFTKEVTNSVRDKLRTIHIVTSVVVLQIAYRITILLKRLNY